MFCSSSILIVLLFGSCRQPKPGVVNHGRGRNQHTFANVRLENPGICFLLPLVRHWELVALGVMFFRDVR